MPVVQPPTLALFREPGKVDISAILSSCYSHPLSPHPTNIVTSPDNILRISASSILTASKPGTTLNLTGPCTGEEIILNPTCFHVQTVQRRGNTNGLRSLIQYLTCTRESYKAYCRYFAYRNLGAPSSKAPAELGGSPCARPD